jgi:hypothetical protein
MSLPNAKKSGPPSRAATRLVIYDGESTFGKVSDRSLNGSPSL